MATDSASDRWANRGAQEKKRDRILLAACDYSRNCQALPAVPLMRHRGITILGSLVPSKSTVHGRPIATSDSSLTMTPATRVTVPSSSWQSSSSIHRDDIGHSVNEGADDRLHHNDVAMDDTLAPVSNHPTSIEVHLLHAGMFGGNQLCPYRLHAVPDICAGAPRPTIRECRDRVKCGVSNSQLSLAFDATLHAVMPRRMRQLAPSWISVVKVKASVARNE
jgi:hypothetical protein